MAFSDIVFQLETNINNKQEIYDLICTMRKMTTNQEFDLSLININENFVLTFKKLFTKYRNDI